MYRIEKTDQFILIYLGLYSNEAANIIDTSINLMISDKNSYFYFLGRLIRDNVLKSWCWRSLDGECYLCMAHFMQIGEWDASKMFEDFCGRILQFCRNLIPRSLDAEVIFDEVCNDNSLKHSARYEELASHPFDPFTIAQLDVLYKERTERLVANCIFKKDLYEKVEEIEDEIKKIMNRRK